MTDYDKVKMVESLVDDKSVSEIVIESYLSLAKSKILDRLYPFDDSVQEIPSKWDMLHCELAARMIFRRGSEGERIHNENGIQRTYASVNDEDILARLTPFVKIVGGGSN